MKKKLALLGGEPTVNRKAAPVELFKWPIITPEDEAACLAVIRNNSFSGFDITEKFQDEFAAWQGTKYAIAYTNGTMSLTAAMFAIGLGMGDEIICPTKTYWGSVSQAINFGASAVFCDIDENLSMDPDDIERCIGPRTKAIMVVHYFGYPAEMDKIMAIAKKYDLKVIEDVSHAHGSLYKGKKVGTFGDVAAMSMMSGKSFAAGEMGMLVTDDKAIYERAMAFGHYERNNERYISDPELNQYSHIALGGVKGRANQLCSELGRGQLKYFDERSAEIDRAMNYFCDRLEGYPGVYPVRPKKGSGSTMGAWYSPQAFYNPAELDGLTSQKFCEAVRAETCGYGIWEGANFPLHNHAFFKTFDLNHNGKPSRIAYAERDVRELDAGVMKADNIRCVTIPRFVKFIPSEIDKYAEAYINVIENRHQLLEKDGGADRGGRWYGTTNE